MLGKLFKKNKSEEQIEEDLLSKTITNSNARNSITNIVAEHWDDIKQLLKEGETLRSIYDNNEIFNEMMSYSEFKIDCYEQYKNKKNS